MATARLFLKFVVAGVAQPRGSKTPIRNGKGEVIGMRDDNPKSGPWMKIVARAASAAMFSARKRPTGKPVLLAVTVYRERPAGHFGTGKNAKMVKPGAPAYPATKPDMTKLVRGIEDALNEIVWTDDAIVVDQRNSKRFGAVPRVEIGVYELPATVAELARETNGQKELV